MTSPDATIGQYHPTVALRITLHKRMRRTERAGASPSPVGTYLTPPPAHILLLIVRGHRADALIAQYVLHTRLAIDSRNQTRKISQPMPPILRHPSIR